MNSLEKLAAKQKLSFELKKRLQSGMNTIKNVATQFGKNYAQQARNPMTFMPGMSVPLAAAKTGRQFLMANRAQNTVNRAKNAVNRAPTAPKMPSQGAPKPPKFNNQLRGPMRTPMIVPKPPTPPKPAY